MDINLNLQHFKLILTLNYLLWTLAAGQVQLTTSNNFDKPVLPPNISRLSLIQTLLSQLNNVQPNTTEPETTEEPSVPRLSLLKALLSRLEGGQPQNSTEQLPQDRLILSLQDGSSSAVSIEFEPRNFTPEQQQGWNRIVEILADALACAILEANQQGYHSNVKYAINVSDIPTEYISKRLNPTTLKSLAG